MMQVVALQVGRLLLKSGTTKVRMSAAGHLMSRGMGWRQEQSLPMMTPGCSVSSALR